MKKHIIAEHRHKQVPHRFMIYGLLGIMIINIITPLLVNYASAREYTAADYADRNVVGETIFEGIGRYAFATAGNNNVYRGDSYESNPTTSALITPEQNSNLPSNWSEISRRFESLGTPITNLSGSKLDVKGGSVKIAALRVFQCENVETTILIGPDGNTIEVEPFEDITNFVNSQSNPTGWYFMFYPNLDISTCNQAAWSITSVYEQSSLDISHIKLVGSNNPIGGSEYPTLEDEEYLLFDSPYTPNGDVQLVGVYLAAGARSWPVAGRTEDETWVVTSDGSERQLFEAPNQIDGRTMFAGRTSTDFANGTFNTIRSHNIKGGELDIFDEMIGKAYFNEKRILGLHFKKTGANILTPSLFGFRQMIEAPVLTVTPHIPSEDPSHPVITLKNISEYKACAIKMVIPLSSIGNPTNVSIDPSTGVTSTIQNGNLIINATSLDASATITITLTVPEPTADKLNIHPVIDYYASIGGECPASTGGNDDVKLTTEGEDEVYLITTKHVDEDGEPIADPVHSYAHTGETYTTTAVEVEGYTLVETPDNHTGTMGTRPITVTYVYRYTRSVDVPNTGAFTMDEKGIIASISAVVIASLCVVVYLIRHLAKRQEAKVHFDKKKS